MKHIIATALCTPAIAYTTSSCAPQASQLVVSQRLIYQSASKSLNETELSPKQTKDVLTKLSSQNNVSILTLPKIIAREGEQASVKLTKGTIGNKDYAPIISSLNCEHDPSGIHVQQSITMGDQTIPATYSFDQPGNGRIIRLSNTLYLISVVDTVKK